MIEPTQVAVDAHVVRDRPLHLDLDTLCSGFTHIDRLSFLKVITSRILDGHNGVSLETLIGGVEIGGIQTHRAVEQISFETKFDILVLLCIVCSAGAR